MAAEPEVRVAIEDHGERGRVATVTFDDARRLNLLGTPMLKQAVSAIEGLADRRDLRAVVVTGAGERAFIGGADIREFAEFNEASAVEFITRIHHLCDAVRRLPVPSIAKIRGYCLGAGMEVAAACDLRAADGTARFGMPEVRVGVPSVIEAALLPGLIGWGKTRELLFTGEMIDADEAERCGFLESRVEAGELDGRVAAWIESILDSGPEAIRLQKRLITAWETLPLPEAIRHGIGVFGEAYRTDEPGRYAGKFLNRRKG
jgi:enoyl-CoA hydratase/carnithine racemase